MATGVMYGYVSDDVISLIKSDVFMTTLSYFENNLYPCANWLFYLCEYTYQPLFESSANFITPMLRDIKVDS